MKNLFAAIAVLLTVVGCGSDSSDISPSIDDVSFRDDTVAPGGNGQVRVYFTPASSPFGEDSDGNTVYESVTFSLVVYLPKGTGFVTGTSKITDSLAGDVLFGNPDGRTPDYVGTCADGRSYVEYNFRNREFGDPTENIQSIYLKFGFSVTAQAAGESVGASTFDFTPGNPCDEKVQDSKVLRVG